MKKLLLTVLFLTFFTCSNSFAIEREHRYISERHAIKSISTEEKVPYIKGMDIKDDFGSQRLNESIWNELHRENNFNNELQYYHHENVKVEDGLLKLTALHEQKGTKEYTSGSIHTLSEMPILYGDIKVIAKHPAGQGLFPAIWLTPVDENKYLPEIDIMEAIGSEPEVIYFVLHYEGENGIVETVSDSFILEEYEQFHTYELKWREDRLEWLIDGVSLFVIEHDIPDEPMKLVINLAVGGNWPGRPSDNSIFPAEFLIDSVEIRNGGEKSLD